MLTLTKRHKDALIGSAAATGCRVVWLKDRAVRFNGALMVNRELTYNPLVRRMVTMLGHGIQPLSLIDELGGKDPLVRAIDQQTLYALANAGFINVEVDPKTMLEAKNKAAGLLSETRVEGERIPLTAYAWFRNQTWIEKPHFFRDECRLQRAIEVPSENVNPSDEAHRDEIKRLVLQKPPIGQIFEEIHKREEQRDEVLEKAGLLSVKVKVVGAEVHNAEFAEDFWLSQCFVFTGIPDTCGCIVRVLKPSRYELERMRREQLNRELKPSWTDRRDVFTAAVQQIIENNETFRDRLMGESEEVKIV